MLPCVQTLTLKERAIRSAPTSAACEKSLSCGPSALLLCSSKPLRGLGWCRASGRPTQAIAVQGFARVNVMRTYPDPLVASNAVGRPLSRFGALSHTVSVSPSRA